MMYCCMRPGSTPVRRQSAAMIHIGIRMDSGVSFTFSNSTGSSPKKTDWPTLTKEARVRTLVTTAMTVTNA